jgi:hypothetical protein
MVATIPEVILNRRKMMLHQPKTMFFQFYFIFYLPVILRLLTQIAQKAKTELFISGEQGL